MISQALHNALLNPEAYPDARGPVEFRETHASHLYFVGDRVYKLKKPVDFGFLNFTTLDRRRFYCHEEVRLNRRFCPEIYLGVAEIRRHGQDIRINGPGRTIDYAVVMKRLPEEKLLTVLIERNDPSLPEKMILLARRIARLHRTLDVFHARADRTNLEVVRNNWQENFSQTEPFIERTVSRRAFGLLAAWIERFFDDRTPLLLRREADGFVRDGHGDLHCQHICFTSDICIYDCIEFNRRFRIADVLADLAFLLMDLEFRDRRDLSSIILDTYLDDSGGKTPDVLQLLTFYKIYRAFVRGKVESFLATDEDADLSVRRQAAATARRYFNLALGYLCRPALIITCGLMGTGKTTLGRALGGSLGVLPLRSDVLRKELAGLAEKDRREVPFERGIYSPAFTERTYDILLQRTVEGLVSGRTVVVDASFALSRQRDRFRQAARRIGVPFLLLHVTCDRATALDRLARRQNRGLDASDGRRELFDRQAAAFERLFETGDLLQIDTGENLDDNVSRILCALIERSGKAP
jgi:aminoglycoside phosphotransferase family enzyme/predicted kinase